MGAVEAGHVRQQLQPSDVDYRARTTVACGHREVSTCSRGNFEVLARCIARRILFEHSRAVGVEYCRRGAVTRARCAKSWLRLAQSVRRSF